MQHIHFLFTLIKELQYHLGIKLHGFYRLPNQIGIMLFAFFSTYMWIRLHLSGLKSALDTKFVDSRGCQVNKRLWIADSNPGLKSHYLRILGSQLQFHGKLASAYISSLRSFYVTLQLPGGSSLIQTVISLTTAQLTRSSRAQGLRAQTSWVCNSCLPHSFCMHVARLLHLSVSYFLHL